MAGRTLSHYRVLEELSRGGMGIIYRAVDLNLNRDVAIKLLSPDLVSDPEYRARLFREARAAAQLEHPHIAVIHEVDEAEGVAFIAMELVRGESLDELLAQEALPGARALSIAREVAEALVCAHDKGIVHRDLKPSNVMVTEEGHAKVIDFGLAKILRPPMEEAAEIATWGKKTVPGTIVGTVTHMSPEQARGGKVDHRSDIFSFGVLLYEMLTGGSPFRRDSPLETLSAILKDHPPPLPRAARAGRVDPIVSRCLAKNPDDRYQDMRDVLKAIQEAQTSRPVPKLLSLAAVVLVAAAVAFFWPRIASEPPRVSTKPSVAVLYFDNASGDPSLDWLRTGLTDMLVTDLSQSPHVEVLSTDRLYQILRELNRADERITSLEVVEAVTRRADVEKVLVGSFMKAGDTIRINIRVQDAKSGRIVASERVEGIGEASIFPMVDDLTERIRGTFDIPEAMELDRNLEDVTTSSVEAYRAYAEGIGFHERYQEQQAIPLFEKALQIDPDFAMAMSKLSAVHTNLGHGREATAYAEKALEHVGRLTARERYYVEGNYYARNEETMARALEAFGKAVELYPDHAGARNNLASQYFASENFEEAIRHAEELMRRGNRFPGTLTILIDAYFSLGETEKAIAAAERFVSDNPENGEGYMRLGQLLARAGKYDEAVQALDRCESLGGSFFLDFARYDLYTLKGDRERASLSTENLLRSLEPFQKWRGFMELATTRLYEGRGRYAVAAAADAAGVFPEGTLAAWAHVVSSRVLLEMGDAAGALREAKAAETLGARNSPGWVALTSEALAYQSLGTTAEADRAVASLAEATKAVPGPKGKRLHHLASGEVALARGDASRAVEELKQAEALLSPVGVISSTGLPQHVLIWYALARAHLAAGNLEEARLLFERILARQEHLHWVIPHVRSHYYLGRIYEDRGETEKAREHYRSFVDFWKDGDLDRAEVEQARKKSTL